MPTGLSGDALSGRGTSRQSSWGSNLAHVCGRCSGTVGIFVRPRQFVSLGTEPGSSRSRSGWLVPGKRRLLCIEPIRFGHEPPRATISINITVLEPVHRQSSFGVKGWRFSPIMLCGCGSVAGRRCCMRLVFPRQDNVTPLSFDRDSVGHVQARHGLARSGPDALLSGSSKRKQNSVAPPC